MKVFALTALMILGLSAQAQAGCGPGSPAQTGAVGEQTVKLSNIGNLVINSNPGVMQKTTKGYDNKDIVRSLVPFRGEFPGDSNIIALIVSNRGSQIRLTPFAHYRCMGSPTYTNNAWLEVGDYDDIEIYALTRENSEIAKDQKPDVTLKGADLKQLLGIAADS
jgi:hypothetical protein